MSLLSRFWKKEEPAFDDLGAFGSSKSSTHDTHDNETISPMHPTGLDEPQFGGSSHGMPDYKPMKDSSVEFGSNLASRPDAFGQLQTQSTAQSFGPQNNGPGNQLIEKDLALISAKLDIVKSQLETISTRLARLEKIAEGSESPHPPRW